MNSVGLRLNDGAIISHHALSLAEQIVCWPMVTAEVFVINLSHPQSPPFSVQTTHVEKRMVILIIVISLELVLDYFQGQKQFKEPLHIG